MEPVALCSDLLIGPEMWALPHFPQFVLRELLTSSQLKAKSFCSVGLRCFPHHGGWIQNGMCSVLLSGKLWNLCGVGVGREHILFIILAISPNGGSR